MITQYTTNATKHAAIDIINFQRSSQNKQFQNYVQHILPRC